MAFMFKYGDLSEISLIKMASGDRTGFCSSSCLFTESEHSAGMTSLCNCVQ